MYRCASQLLRAQTEGMVYWQEDALTLTRVGCDIVQVRHWGHCHVVLIHGFALFTTNFVISYFDCSHTKLCLHLFMFTFNICSSQDSRSQALSPKSSTAPLWSAAHCCHIVKFTALLQDSHMQHNLQAIYVTFE